MNTRDKDNIKYVVSESYSWFKRAGKLLATEIMDIPDKLDRQVQEAKQLAEDNAKALSNKGYMMKATEFKNEQKLSDLEKEIKAFAKASK